MITENDVLEMLRSGKSREEIAKTFTTMLNSASAKEEEAKRAEKAKREKMLDDALSDMLDDLYNYARIAAPDVAEMFSPDKKTMKEFRLMFDELIEIARTMSPLVKESKSKETDPLKNFLRANGL